MSVVPPPDLLRKISKHGREALFGEATALSRCCCTGRWTGVSDRGADDWSLPSRSLLVGEQWYEGNVVTVRLSIRLTACAFVLDSYAADRAAVSQLSPLTTLQHVK